MTSLALALAGPPPLTMAQVLSRMDAIDAFLPSGDGIKAFNQLYRTVTAAVMAAEAEGVWESPKWLAHLDVVFGGLYFQALREFLSNPNSCPKAWAPLFEKRGQDGITPLQFALAGMNAHINRDLAVAVERACQNFGITPTDDSPEHRDYLRVNDLLAQVEPEATQTLLTGWMGDASQAAGQADDLAALWSITAARSAAWVNARVLTSLSSLPPLHDAHLASLDRTVGFAGRGLLRPRWG